MRPEKRESKGWMRPWAGFGATLLLLSFGSGCAHRLSGLSDGSEGARSGTRHELPAPPLLGEVRGRVAWDDASAEPSPLPVVVYLEPSGERRGESPSASRHRRFELDLWREENPDAPVFAAVPAGNKLRFRNDDRIYHRVFSTSVPNAFELPLLPAGASKSHRFSDPGVVRLYCALHEWESGVLFVAPTAHVALVEAPGRFVFRKVPPGRYLLKAWGEGIAPQPVELVVGPGAATRVELRVAGVGSEDLHLAGEGGGP